MKLCMFCPRDRELERGWPGRIDGDRVIQLAAQTLEAFFTGGGGAREHAEYALADVVLRAPVLRPPTVRVFVSAEDFVFANSSAIFGPDDTIVLPGDVDEIVPVLRPAAVIGAGGAIGGFAQMNDWLAPSLAGVKAHDFAISLGPVVVTPDEAAAELRDWELLVAHAGANTRLLPGDVVAASESRPGPPARAGDVVEVGREPFGLLRNAVVAPG